MALKPGTQLGPYEITAHIGSGGMGDVYRARDSKLQRDVAIKVLPESFAADPDRLARFEREARAVAALSHPGILAVHDFARSNGVTYTVMELLDGVSLRSRLDSAPLPPRRRIEIAVQIARALGAAHEKGIVHRDIKPENIFITTDGRVKVLDFGLARLTASPLHAATDATVTRLDTADGVVLGTVGYMSPEQVRGITADHRSDIFSAGVVLYEMLAGRRPFGGASAVETMNAILKDDPAPLALTDAALPPALTTIVEHCLEKEPGERFQSAQDLAFNLDALRNRSDSSVQAIAPRRRRSPMLIAAAAVVLGAIAVGVFAGRAFWRESGRFENATFTRLTYDTGTIWNGRFAPDGQNVVFAAAWNGAPIRSFLSRTDRTGSTPLTLPNASLLSVSSSGELAVSVDHAFDGWMGQGTLARAAMLAGAPRALVEHVREADWTPDGSDLAVVRRVEGRERLEFPIGKVLYETNGYISHIRFSRDGERIAFADHPLYGDDNGDLAVVDRAGKKTTLATAFQGLRGVCWSPDGREVWFTAMSTPYAGVSLRAASLDGQTRTLLALPTDWRILDVTTDGRLLMMSEIVARHVELRKSGEAPPLDLSLFEQSIGSAISDDGAAVLISDQGSFSGAEYATYLRRLDQPTAVRLGEGQAVGFSSHADLVLSLVSGPPSRLILLPVGAGQRKELPNPQQLTIPVATLLPDDKRVAFIGSQGRGLMRGYIQDIQSGEAKPFTEPGVNAPTLNVLPVSPDGLRAWLVGPDGRPYLYPLDGGAPQPISGVNEGESPIRWARDQRSVYVGNVSGTPQRIFRVELQSGSRTLVKELFPTQAAGVRRSEISMTPDGQMFLHSYSRLLANLYVVDGLK